jgi:hypothetical protein
MIAMAVDRSESPKYLLVMHVSGQVDVPKTIGFGVNKPGPVLVNRASQLALM